MTSQSSPFFAGISMNLTRTFLCTGLYKINIQLLTQYFTPRIIPKPNVRVVFNIAKPSFKMNQTHNQFYAMKFCT